MKSVEFVLPLTVSGVSIPEELFERFRVALTKTFAGYTQRDGRRFCRDGNGKMHEEPVLICEVAFAGTNFDEVSDFARPFAAELKTSLETKFDGDTVLIGEAEFPKVNESEKPVVSDWPIEFDVAIQTVIGKELQAVQDHFYVEGDARSHEGTIYYRGKVIQPAGDLSVVVCCQSSAGSDAAAVIAERLISLWHPKAIFLMGIAAGRRGKCKIGDVVTPRVIVDDTEGVLEAEKRLRRPQIYPPPHAMIQQLQNFRFDRVKSEWHANLVNRCDRPKPPVGKEDEYMKGVADVPTHHDAAIYSSDLLLRQAEYLEKRSEDLHQQIRIGEMESAGFGTACNQRSKPIPWFVVRGVSDFGDDFKDDVFHGWAAHAAASYLYLLIRDGINMSLF